MDGAPEGANEFADRGDVGDRLAMESHDQAGTEWVEELVRFLRTQPEVTAVRIDPTAHRVAVATVGNVALDGLESKLAGPSRRSKRSWRRRAWVWRRRDSRCARTARRP